MVNYRRNKTGNPDDIFFFTAVTNNRFPWLADADKRDLALTVLRRIRTRFRIAIKAWVILPEHFHLMLSPGQSDYSKVLYSFKKGLSLEFKKLGLVRTGEHMWQDRFWEETIKSDEHYDNCVSYIHYNPVKHGLVDSPIKWEHSSIHAYVKRGHIASDWCDGNGIVIAGGEHD
jgi:putative transposase